MNASARGLLVALKAPLEKAARVRVQVTIAGRLVTLGGRVTRVLPDEAVQAPEPAKVAVFVTEVEERWINFCADLARA